jgi:putative phosphoribosyl transferase
MYVQASRALLAILAAMTAVSHGVYRDRQAAGRELAQLLQRYAGDPNVLILALPRGGLPIASEIAHALRAPLDVLVVRKLGLPGQPELAAGAIGPCGVIVRNPQVIPPVSNLDAVLAEVAARELIEMQRRDLAYRSGRGALEVQDRIVILVDDGVATGSTMEAAVLALRAMTPRAIVVAVPVAPPEAVELLKRSADRVVCARQPQPFFSVGECYADFPQLTDAEVVATLARHEVEPWPSAGGGRTQSKGSMTCRALM